MCASGPRIRLDIKDRRDNRHLQKNANTCSIHYTQSEAESSGSAGKISMAIISATTKKPLPSDVYAFRLYTEDNFHLYIGTRAFVQTGAAHRNMDEHTLTCNSFLGYLGSSILGIVVWAWLLLPLELGEASSYNKLQQLSHNVQ